MSSPTTPESEPETEVLDNVPEVASEPFDWQPWLWGGLLAFLVLLVYWPALSNGYIWDDDAHVLSNLALREPAGLYNMWFKWGTIPQYYPLVHTTLWVEYQIWGFDPHGYHLVNMLWHAAGVILLWRVLLRLNVPGAWLAAAIFAVHPVCVESVAWVSELKNVQSCAFALASILVYLRYAPPDEPADAKRPTEGWDYELALGLFVAALLSKTVTAVVPAVLLVIYWWKRGRITSRDVGELIPFFIFGAVLGSITVWLETTYVGAAGAEWNYSLVERMLIAGRALWFYAGKLVWPHPLVFFYPRFDIDARVWWQYLFPVGAVATLVALWLARGTIGRGPAAAALIFTIGVAPALGFFNVYPFRYALVADHFQYQASIALLTLTAAALTLIGRNLPRVVAAAAGGLLLVPLVVAAHQQTHVYENLETLYTAVIAENPDSWMAQINLADFLDHRGRTDEAIPHYRAGLETMTKSNWHLGDLSRALSLTDQLDAGIAQFEEDLTAEHSDLESAELHRHLADVLHLANRDDDAIKHYEAALELNEKSPLALASLGQLLIDKQQVDEGIEKLHESLELSPHNALAQQNLGIALRKQGKLDDAIQALALAAQLGPNNAKTREELATVLLLKGDVPNAANQLQMSLMLDDKSAPAHNLAGMIRAQEGKLDLAEKEFETALMLDPAHVAAKSNLEKLREFLAQQKAAAAAAVPANGAPAANVPGAPVPSGEATKEGEEKPAASPAEPPAAVPSTTEPSDPNPSAAEAPAGEAPAAEATTPSATPPSAPAPAPAPQN
ncbi:MAG TPA: tetratricopeptide repeat protein [Pirellulales bacterium]|jgi:tetratricopeptide (TPR) repeat protein